MNKLEGKYILITGASEGLGRQLVLEYARQGAAALAFVARRGNILNELENEIKDIAPNTVTLPIEADLSDLSGIERVIAMTLSAFGGRLDVLVNNASALGPSPMPMLVDYPLADFTKVLTTNVLAPFLLIQKALPALIARSGSIINVTSDAGITGYPGWGAYGISKFALEGLSQTWAAELEEGDVRVNWVDPGNMNTKMHRLAEPDEDPQQWADPRTVTPIFVYLASDDSKQITGRRYQAQEDKLAEAMSA
jgi:NAD(P)-dependent dehydrogenase (short-subunit alcohol dehydrogenase family)